MLRELGGGDCGFEKVASSTNEQKGSQSDQVFHHNNQNNHGS